MSRLFFALLVLLSVLWIGSRVLASSSAPAVPAIPNAREDSSRGLPSGATRGKPSAPRGTPPGSMPPTSQLSGPEPATTPAVASELSPAGALRPATRTPVLDRLVRIETRRKIGLAARSVYFDSLFATADSVVRRWDDREGMPLRVAYTGDVSRLPRLVELMRTALRTWEDASLGIRFAQAQDTAGADIVVGWVDRFQQDPAAGSKSGPVRSGQTDLLSDDRGAIRSARVSIALTMPDGRPLGDPEWSMVAIHEIGHALGLPHSADPSDIMYPTVTVGRLSPRDRATITLLYSIPPGSIREPESR